MASVGGGNHKQGCSVSLKNTKKPGTGLLPCRMRKGSLGRMDLHESTLVSTGRGAVQERRLGTPDRASEAAVKRQL